MPLSENLAATPEQPSALTRPLLMTMAIACGLAIANLYYNQPLLPQIQRTFGVSEREVGILPMLTQSGFALGVFLLAPLGDVVERRRLILTMLVLVSVAIAVAAFSPNLPCLAVASFVIGITSVISHAGATVCRSFGGVPTSVARRWAALPVPC